MFNGSLSRTTRATRRRMPYKWRQICSNSLVIISTLENENIAKTPYKKCAPAVTVSEKLICLIFYLEKVGQGHEVEKQYLAVRSQIFECVLLIFFHNVSCPAT